MSVKSDSSGRRWVEIEIEVPGTPEEVWQAIATGPGISSWFVPTQVDERVGGLAKASFGPGMDSISTITEWAPPRRMAADSEDLGPDAPKVATEWIVETVSGETCRVKVVHSLFTDADDWDKELEAWESGWPAFFRLLRLYLTHFSGASSELIQLSAQTSLEPEEAWTALSDALGVTGLSEGDRRNIRFAESTPLSIYAEHASTKAPHTGELLLRLEGDIPALAHWFALPMGKSTVLSLRFYLYGETAAETRATLEPLWQDWIARHVAPHSSATDAP